MKRRKLTTGLPDPYAAGDGWTIYHASFHDVLPHLDLIDLCLTDPPYSVNYERSHQTWRGGSAKVHGAYHEADIDPADCLRFLDMLPADRLIMTYPVDRHFIKLAMAFKRSGWRLRKELVWGKDRFSFWINAQYQQQHEPILICTRKNVPLGSAVPNNIGTILRFPKTSRHQNHPTEKPLQLWQQLIEFHTTTGQAVLDPFMGSGTTGVACVQMGRKFVGVEIEKQYCDVAVRRLREAERGGLLDMNGYTGITRRQPSKTRGLVD